MFLFLLFCLHTFAMTIFHKCVKRPARTLNKKRENLMRFVMFPGPQNDAEMGSKWTWVKWVFLFLFGSLLAHCYEMAPERPKHHLFFKMVPIWTAFLRIRLSFLTIVLALFHCPLSFFEEKDINMWAPLCFLFGFLFKLFVLLFCYNIKYEKTWEFFSTWSAPEQV